MSSCPDPYAPAASETRREWEDGCVEQGSDAADGGARTTNDTGTNETKRNGRTDDGADDDATEDEERRPAPVDPDSPGATIDSPTPAEPNEPG
jgi:hypothetical protein